MGIFAVITLNFGTVYMCYVFPHHSAQQQQDANFPQRYVITPLASLSGGCIIRAGYQTKNGARSVQ